MASCALNIFPRIDDKVKSLVATCEPSTRTRRIALSEGCVHTRSIRQTTLWFFAATYTLHKLLNVLFASRYVSTFPVLNGSLHRVEFDKNFRASG